MEKFTLNFEPCYMCSNTRVKVSTNTTSEPSDENDSSLSSVGYAAGGYQMHMYSGGSTPVHLGVTAWDEDSQKDIKLGCCYYPKFCPNCGRPLAEYDPDWIKYGITDLPFEVRYYIKDRGLLNLTPDPLGIVLDLFRWKIPDSAHYDEAQQLTTIEYMDTKCQVQVTSSLIKIVYKGRDIALFKFSMFEDCIARLTDIQNKSESTVFFTD